MEIKPKPVFNNILIKPREAKQIVQGFEGNLCEYGDVIDVGSQVQEIKVGDIIVFTKWGMKHIEIENEKFYFIPEDGRFILGTVSMPGHLAS